MKKLTGSEALKKSRELMAQMDCNILMILNLPNCSLNIMEFCGKYYKTWVDEDLYEHTFEEVTKQEADTIMGMAQHIIEDDKVQVKFGGF